MTPARAQLEGVVGAMRRKQLLAVAITALVEMLLVAAAVYALVRLGLPNLVLSKPRRLVLAFGLLLVFVAALLLEQARQSRSMLYLAKRIDSENQLDDHLVSALSFVDPVILPFERACVDALIVRLQHQQLRIPEVRLERVWLLVPALLIAGATGLVEYRRRTRPQDDGSFKVTLPADLRERAERINQVAIAAADKVDPVLAKQAQETRKMIDQLIDRTATKESVIKELSAARATLAQYERDNPSLVDAAMQLGDPSTQRANQLLGAIKTGQPSAVNEALKTLVDAMSGNQPPPLSDTEREEVREILEKMAGATKQAPLAEKLNEAASSMRDKATTPEAARPLEAARQPLVEALTREAAARQLSQSMKNALAEAGRQTELQARKAKAEGVQVPGGAPSDGGAAVAGVGSMGLQPGAPGGSDDSNEDATGDSTGNVATKGGGAGTDRDTNLGGGSPEKPDTGRDEHISSPWVGAAVKQLVAAGSSSDQGAQSAARALLSAEQRALEREVRREEIPAEYAQSIRRYFFNLQRDWEQKWKPSK